MRDSNKALKIMIILLLLLLLSIFTWVIWDEVNGKQHREYIEIPEQTFTENYPENTEAENTKMETTESDWFVETDQLELIEEEQEDQSSTILLFGGDVYLSDHVLNAYDKTGGISGVLDQKLQDQIDMADIFMVNQEFPFSERGVAAADKQYTFRLPPKRVNILKEMKVDIVTLANNHILDFGTEALLDSCSVLDEAGILYVGAGEGLDRAKKLEIIEVGEKTIGFLGMSRVYMDASWAAGKNHPGVFSTYDSKLPAEEIKNARDACDYLVVYVHWGIERETSPEEYQRQLAKAYIDAGADIIVGSHPHVLQGLEYYKGKPIIYSLGNFVFGSSIPKTALLKVELGDDKDEPVLSLIPCTSSAGFTKMITDEGKKAGFYQEMSELSFGVTIGADGFIQEK